MAKIQRLKLTNYKSFRSLDFEFGSLNILIGRNGAGKSNLLSFLRLLSKASDGQLADTIRAMGGINEVRWRGSKKDQPLEWELTLEHLKQLDNRFSTCYYIGSMAARGNSFSVRLEEISHDPFPGYSDRFKYLSASDGYIRILKANPEGERSRGIDPGIDEDANAGGINGSSYRDQELAITQLRDPIRYPLLDEIRATLADWTIFRGFGENALRNIYDAQPLDVVSPLRLDAEGKNLVSVLYTLREDRRYSSAYDELLETLSAVFTDFKKLNFPLVASSKAELQWEEKSGWLPFPSYQVSDGMLRFLGLATLLLLPEPPALIAIDEPEVGLHPGLIPVLGGLLKVASTRTQIIVATHSPQLLNADDIDSQDVVIVDRIEGETRFQRLDQLELRLWLERYSLGDLWTLGKLEHS